MNKSLEKKIPQYTHRRVKTDLSIRPEERRSEIADRINQTRANRRYKTQLRQSKFEKHSSDTKFNYDNLKSSRREITHNLSYNKWYIRPEVRMKKSLIHEIKYDGIDHQFVYNKLYEQNTARQDCPFKTIKNSKLKLLQKIPVHNLRLLQTFKKNQELNKKRVPKIIELFLKRKGPFKQP